MSGETINLIDWRSKSFAPMFDGKKNLFYVEKTVNVLDPRVGTWINERSVKDLINYNFKVNVRPPKANDWDLDGPSE